VISFVRSGLNTPRITPVAHLSGGYLWSNQSPPRHGTLTDLANFVFLAQAEVCHHGCGNGRVRESLKPSPPQGDRPTPLRKLSARVTRLLVDARSQ
jgi:hypothetical protein